MNNAKMSYAKRNTGNNFAEDFFEYYCKNYFIVRLGFDEKFNSIPKFYNLNPIIRNIPDYFVYANDKTFLCNVKGTANIKQKEIDLLPGLIASYASKNCPLIYAFCFMGTTRPLFRTAEQIIELYANAYDKTWHDGVVYRTLKMVD